MHFSTNLRGTLTREKNDMFTPSGGKFSEKPRKWFYSRDSLISHKRICKKCGEYMDVVERIRTTLNFVLPIPGEKNRFRCRRCFKEITIRSLTRLCLYIIIGTFSLSVIVWGTSLLFKDFISGNYDISELIGLLIGFLILFLFPIISILEIYKRIKYPVINAK